MKMYCYECNKDVNPVFKTIREHYTYRDKEFDVNNECAFCPFCDNELMSDVIDKQLENIYNGYLVFYGLNLDSFKDVRNSFNLTQELFAKALGFSKRSIIRYEKHEEIPSGEYLKVYRKLNENKDYIFECLQDNKVNLSDEDYYAIVNKISLSVSMKSRNAILYVLNKAGGMFTLPLLKNLFAMDFLSYKERNRAITDFKYIKLKFGPVVDNYVDVLNQMMVSGEIKFGESIYINDDIKSKYVALKECDLQLFSLEEIKIMDKVISKLNGKSAKDLSDWSHEFEGWKKTKLKEVISFQKYATFFEL